MVLAAALVTKGFWADPAGRALGLNANDQALDEWFLAYATRAYRGDFHLVTGALNAPDGINVLGNASLVGLGVLLAPLTLAFGAPVTFAVATAGNLAANGAPGGTSSSPAPRACTAWPRSSAAPSAASRRAR